MARLFGQKKFATIQHHVNPSCLPTYEVRFKLDDKTCVVSGQVLFFDMDGLAVQKKQACYCAVYCEYYGDLLVLLALPSVELIVKKDSQP